MKKKIAIIAVVVVFVVAAVLFFTKGSDEQGRVKINISASSLTKGGSQMPGMCSLRIR